MNVKEAVKDRENYSSIVTYYKNLKTLDTDQLTVLIDVIDEMSEENFEHYKALHTIFKEAVANILKRRQEEGNFTFLTDSQKNQLSYAIEKAGRLHVLLWEKYELLDKELKN